MSYESDELRLFADNDSGLYRVREAYLENMRKKMKRGVYDPKKGVKLWEYFAARAAKEYNRQLPGTAKFTVAQRREAATVWERQARAELKGR